jgi:hypothetical protein
MIFRTFFLLLLVSISIAWLKPGIVIANYFFKVCRRRPKKLRWAYNLGSVSELSCGRSTVRTKTRELECFFSNLPGFRKSNDDEDFLDRLTGDQKENLWSGLVGFLDRTFSSDSLLEDDKTRRAKICADALQVDPLAFPYILDSVISEDQCAPVQSAELAPFVTGLDAGKYEDAPMLKQAIVSCVVATARLRNDEWFTIASEEMGVEKSDLRHYTPPDGPDLSLAILIHVTCQQLHHFKDPSWPSDKFSKVLRAASKFKVQEASSQLQNGFCSLWNLLVGKAQDDEDGDGRKIARFILRPIYKVYVDIHQRSYACRRDTILRPHTRPH